MCSPHSDRAHRTLIVLPPLSGDMVVTMVSLGSNCTYIFTTPSLCSSHSYALPSHSAHTHCPLTLLMLPSKPARSHQSHHISTVLIHVLAARRRYCRHDSVLTMCFAHFCAQQRLTARSQGARAFVETTTLSIITTFSLCSSLFLPLSGGIVDTTHTELLKILKRCIKDLELSKPDLTDWLEIPLSHFEQWLEGEITAEKAAVSALSAFTLQTVF